MNTLFRTAALVILGLLLAMPVITLHGSLHLVLLIACAVVLGRELLEPGIWQLCALGGYALLIGAFYVDGFGEWLEINSQQMRQVSMLLLAFVALRGASLSEIHALFAFILVTAVVGALGEMAGLNMHALLPSKVMEQEYYKDAMFLAGGVQRFRGFFTESSILLAVTTSFGFVAAIGALAVKGRGRFVAAAAIGGTIAVAILWAVTLAKTGLVIALAGCVGVAAAVLLNLRRKHLPLLIIGGVITVLLVATTAFLLPASVKDYLAEDAAALPLALEGNRAVEASSSGLLTRIECWRLALETVRRFPLGVGFFGIEHSYFTSRNVTLTGELVTMFRLGIFGLKNTIANVLAQTGVPGATLLVAALWQAFIRPLRAARRAGVRLPAGPAAVYLASFCISVVFLASCETYYWMALLAVLKCYADAVAGEQGIADAPESYTEDEAELEIAAPAEASPA